MSKARKQVKPAAGQCLMMGSKLSKALSQTHRVLNGTRSIQRTHLHTNNSKHPRQYHQVRGSSLQIQLLLLLYTEPTRLVPIDPDDSAHKKETDDTPTTPLTKRGRRRPDVEPRKATDNPDVAAH